MSDVTAYREWHRALRTFKLSADHHPCDWCGNWASRWIYDGSRADAEQGSGAFVFVEDTSAYVPLCDSCTGTFTAARRRLSYAELVDATPQLAAAARENVSAFTRADVLADTAKRREVAAETQMTRLGRAPQSAVRTTNDLLSRAYASRSAPPPSL
ncbi:hypothetical protein ACN6K6_007465 [Streptomyces violaceoruber]|uniref:hypothetical protein n=1 Tax=Streptomyces violaceoruber TaxID=1935 RepID=UPI00403C2977